MYCIHWWKSTMLFLVRYHRNEVMSKHPEGSFLIKSKRVFIYMPRDNLVYYYYPLYSSLLDFVFLFISLYSLFSTSLCKEFVWFHLFPQFLHLHLFFLINNSTLYRRDWPDRARVHVMLELCTVFPKILLKTNSTKVHSNQGNSIN